MYAMTDRPLHLLPPEALLRINDVLALVGLRRSSIYGLIRQRKFPPPTKLTATASAWRLSEVRRWLADPPNWAPGTCQAEDVL